MAQRRIDDYFTRPEVLTESLRRQRQDALAGHQSRRFIIGSSPTPRSPPLRPTAAVTTIATHRRGHHHCDPPPRPLPLRPTAAVTTITTHRRGHCHCDLLHAINLSFCLHITDAAVLAIASHCHNHTARRSARWSDRPAPARLALTEITAKTIFLAGCHNITDAAKATLRESDSSLTIHD